MIKRIEAEEHPYFPPREVFHHKFRFFDHAASAVVISCGHYTEEDLEYVKDCLALLGDPGSRTLFVEQGSPRQVDHFVSQLRAIAKVSSLIAADFQSKLKSQPISLLQPGYYRRSVYASASEQWIGVGGQVVNMDLDANLSKEAMAWFIDHASARLALEKVYVMTRGACYSIADTMPLILAAVFPGMDQKFISHTFSEIHSIYQDQWKGIERHLSIWDDWYRLRENYMVRVLEQKMKEGDVILAHPHHVSAIKQLTS